MARRSTGVALVDNWSDPGPSTRFAGGSSDSGCGSWGRERTGDSAGRATADFEALEKRTTRS